MAKCKNSELLIFIQLYNGQIREELANVPTQEFGTIDPQCALYLYYFLWTFYCYDDKNKIIFRNESRVTNTLTSSRTEKPAHFP